MLVATPTTSGVATSGKHGTEADAFFVWSDMAKGRLLNQNVCISGRMDALRDDTTRLFATWTIPWLDKNGVFHATPQIVRAHIFPLKDDMTAAHVASMLGDMERVGLIVRFESGGRMWQAWPGFAHNQPNLRGERERTEYPAPPTTPDVARENPAVDGQLPDVRGEKPAELNSTKHNSTEGTAAARGGKPPNLDEAAKAAGIDRQPSIRSKKAKAAAKKSNDEKYDISDLQGYPSLQIYWDVFPGILLPRELAQRIVDSVGEPTRWEETCKEWAKGNPVTGKTWNPLSVDKMLVLYAAKCAQGRAKQNGKAPSPSQRSQLAEIEARAGAVLGAA